MGVAPRIRCFLFACLQSYIFHIFQIRTHKQLKTKDPYLARMIEASKFALHRLVVAD